MFLLVAPRFHLAVCTHAYIDVSTFYRNFLPGQCANIFNSISGRKIHPGIVVIIVDSHNHTHAVQITCKCKLTIGKQQFCVASIAQSRCILSDLTKSCNESSARIITEGRFVIFKIKCWSQTVIGRAFFTSFDPKLRTIINTWNARKGIEQNMNRSKVLPYWIALYRFFLHRGYQRNL